MKRFLAFTALALSASVALAQSKMSPIVDAQTGYLLGGWQNGKWISDKQTAKALRGDEKYLVYGLSSRLGPTTGGKPKTDEAPCNETQWVRLKENFNGVLAVGGSWNAQPRTIRLQNTNQRIYRNAVRRVLQQNGIKKPDVNITQLWRVDLDGDGTDEVLLSASKFDGQKAGPMNISSSAKAGEYSVVLLRKVVKGKVHTIVLGGEYHTKNTTFSAPWVHRLAGVLDANGDGKMEIILRGRYYEGEGISLLEVKGNTATEVLSSGCGA